MSYRDIYSLPESVRDHLPVHAQHIYLAAFNNAWEEYNHDEERSHRVAWAAVKHQYIKDESTGEWKPRTAAATKNAKA